MCDALRELMAPELNEARQRGMQQGVKNTVIKSLAAGNSVADISRVMQISVEEVEAIAKGR